MNVEQANAISLPKILEKMGMTPVKQSGVDLWYRSPLSFRDMPGFHVDVLKNAWHDLGSGEKGKVVDFICAYLKSREEDHAIADALRWLESMEARSVLDLFPATYATASLKLRKVSHLQHRSLLHFLDARGISLAIARKHLKEVIVHDGRNQSDFYAIGLPNESDGYEVRNKTFRGFIAPRGISLVRGEKLLPDDVHVFSSFLDFLSVLTTQKRLGLAGDAIILNGVSNLPETLPYIRNYSYKTMHTWLDNNPAGMKATHALQDIGSRQRMSLRPMNAMYALHRDVNAWHRHQLKL